MTMFLVETAFIFLKQEFLYRAFEEKTNEENDYGKICTFSLCARKAFG